MKEYQVAIIGGGFSGLVLACSLKKMGVNGVIVLERLNRVGKKILSTGNGRGNVTNKNLSLACYHGSNVSFAEYALKKFDNEHIEGFFKEKGLTLASDGDKLFPSSFQANAILETLRFYLNESDILCEKYVTSVKRKGELFEIAGEGFSYLSKNVVFAFGGECAKNFGTDGSSYHLAEGFGHKLEKRFPSLVQMRVEKGSVNGLKGVKQNALVTLNDGQKQIKSSLGDFLFSDNAVSGNTVFYLSAYLPNLKKPKLIIDFAPNNTLEEVVSVLKIKTKVYGEMFGSNLLQGFVHSALSMAISSRFNLQNKKLKDFSNDEISLLANTLKNFVLIVTGTFGFDYAQVTRGGISTSDICEKTFESKLQSGLYFCGEAIDIDGDCGGYNLQWAYSSAQCVAEAIYEKSRNS